MNVSIGGEPGNYWITRDGEDHGPFATLFDASYTAVMMVTSEIRYQYTKSPAVYFINPRVTN